MHPPLRQDHECRPRLLHYNSNHVTPALGATLHAAQSFKAAGTSHSEITSSVQICIHHFVERQKGDGVLVRFIIFSKKI